MEDCSAIAETLYREWQEGRVRPEGLVAASVEARHATIADDFQQLSEGLKRQYMVAAQRALHYVVHAATLEGAARQIHDAWVERNREWISPALTVSYYDLPQREKEYAREAARVVSRLTLRPLADWAHAST